MRPYPRRASQSLSELGTRNSELGTRNSELDGRFGGFHYIEAGQMLVYAACAGACGSFSPCQAEICGRFSTAVGSSSLFNLMTTSGPMSRSPMVCGSNAPDAAS